MSWTRDKQNLFALGLVAAVCAIWLRSWSEGTNPTAPSQRPTSPPSPVQQLQAPPPQPASDQQETYRLPVEDELHAVGVYEGYYPGGGSPHGGGIHPEGAVDVIVDRPGKTLNLVFSSYEPVRWRVRVKAGRVAHVLLSGYHKQRVTGLPQDASVIASTYEQPGGFHYFYHYPSEDVGSSMYQQQENAEKKQRMLSHLAQPIDSEQGEYKAFVERPYVVHTSVRD